MLSAKVLMGTEGGMLKLTLLDNDTRLAIAIAKPNLLDASPFI